VAALSAAAFTAVVRRTAPTEWFVLDVSAPAAHHDFSKIE
jgi:hypothetical protein